VILDIITFTATAPGAGGAAAAPVTGDSATVQSGPEETSGYLVGLWTKAQAAGFTQVLFPFGHDMSRNIRYPNIANSPTSVLERGSWQPMKSQDLIQVTQAGSAVAGDVELVCAQIAYPNVGGGSDKFIDSAELDQRIEEMVTINDTVTATAASAYSGARTLNQVTTALKANRDYAVLGALIGITCAALTVRGQDTANRRCAIPGQATVANETKDYFVRLARDQGMPLIPVLNAANQGGTFIEVMQDENLTAVPFALILALLEPI
jgi:hypothetical protein